MQTAFKNMLDADDVQQKRKCLTSYCSNSDFQVLFDAFRKGQVRREILSNCELVYICKFCRNLYLSLEKYTEHYDNCKERLKRLFSEYDCVGKDNRHSLNESLNESPDNCQAKENEIGESTGETIVPIASSVNKEFINECIDKPTTQFKNVSNSQVTMNNSIGRGKHCLICKQKFPSECELKKHVAIVHSKGFKCKFCNFRSKFRFKCKEHFIEFHNDDNLVDNFYNVALKAKSIRNDSTRKISPGNKNLSIKPADYSGLAMPCTAKDVKKKNEADELPFGFSNNNSLGLSIKNFPETNEPIQSIEDISETHSYGNAQDMMENATEGSPAYCVTVTAEQEKNIDIKKLLCLICNKNFANQQCLLLHLAVIHFGHKRFKCRKCEYKSSFVLGCKRHSLEMHNENILGNIINEWFLRLHCRLENTAIRRIYIYNSVVSALSPAIANGSKLETPAVLIGEGANLKINLESSEERVASGAYSNSRNSINLNNNKRRIKPVERLITELS